jgi:hypothetical protein
VCTVETSDDGQRNCLKHVEFYSKNKFEKLVYLVGFIIRIYHDAKSPECQIHGKSLLIMKENSCESNLNFVKDVPKMCVSFATSVIIVSEQK